MSCKHTFGFLFILIFLVRLDAQNVGIGTISPVAKLHVEATAGQTARFNSTSSQMYIQFLESGVTRGYVGSYAGAQEDVDFGTSTSNNTGKLHLSITGQPKMTLDNSGNVGIGSNILPQYKLDLDGRMRIRNTSNSAGIWFDGTTDPVRSFIGTMNNDYVGMYGLSAGWNFVMNVDNGNTGIGTTSPTQRLDVNGNVRIRGSAPKTGSVLTSSDQNGNALWQDPVAFRTVGLAGGTDVMIPKDTWTKVNYNTSPKFNLSFNYQPFLSQFVCAEKGIYEFDMQLSYHFSYKIGYHRLRLMVDRGGSIEELLLSWQPTLLSVGADQNARLNVSSGAVELLPGDKVWVETYINFVDDPDGNSVSSAPLLGNSLTWFSGHLITRS